MKLVAYFVLLSLLPIAAAFWGFTSVAGQSETRRVDARLQAGLRAALATYQERLDNAQNEATLLARAPVVQRALERHDPLALAHLVGEGDGVAVRARGFHAGSVPPFSATRTVSVVTRRGLAGTVTVAVPFDARLVRRLRSRSGLARDDVLAILQGDRLAVAAPALRGRVEAPLGRTATVPVAGRRFRALAAPAVSGLGGVRFAVLSPQSRIDAANASARNSLLLGLVMSLLLVSGVAYFEGRAIVRALAGLAEAAQGIARGDLRRRVRVRGRDEFALLAETFNDMASQLEARVAELENERARVRDSVTRFGEALAATHDTAALLRVVAETAVEATGAAGARLVAADGSVVETGTPDAGGVELQFPLTAGRTTFGTLTLVGAEFDAEQRMTAGSLAAQSVVALENARLHRIVERQALADGLTGIANRRQCEEALSREVARAERLGSPLTLVIADLDDFKAVNDLHGHAVGDDVLRELAAVLVASIREVDLAGRWGGEEFLLLLPGTDAEGGVAVAERVRTALGERAVAGRDGEPVLATCSFGVARHRVGDGPRELFAAADRALYRAKREGKDRVATEAAVRSF